MRQLQFYSDKYFGKKNHNPVTSCTLAILIAFKKTTNPHNKKTTTKLNTENTAVLKPSERDNFE